jgi:hypothetical protein
MEKLPASWKIEKTEEIMKTETFRTIIALAASCLLISSANASDDTRSYSGIIRKEPWTKSSESFCAGGSDYFVLETGTGREILNSDRSTTSKEKKAVSQEELLQFVGKKVTIEAIERIVPIKCGMGEQCLVGRPGAKVDLICSYLAVLKVAVTSPDTH